MEVTLYQETLIKLLASLGQTKEFVLLILSALKEEKQQKEMLENIYGS